MFVYGHPDSMPKFTCGGFPDEETTIAAAQEYWHECPWETLLAIWITGSQVILALVYDGMVYRPE